LKKKTDLWEKELWTQSEVAEYFRVVPGTIKNWRERGYLSYYQAPGSSRVLFFRNEIKDFIDRNKVHKKGGGGYKDKSIKVISSKKPVVSTNADEDWRI
jgi:hypothetical protein